MPRPTTSITRSLFFGGGGLGLYPRLPCRDRSLNDRNFYLLLRGHIVVVWEILSPDTDESVLVMENINIYTPTHTLCVIRGTRVCKLYLSPICLGEHHNKPILDSLELHILTCLLFGIV